MISIISSFLMARTGSNPGATACRRFWHRHFVVSAGGRLALALEDTADLFSCDHFVEPRYKLGNIRKSHMLELVASQQQRHSGPTSASRSARRLFVYRVARTIIVGYAARALG